MDQGDGSRVDDGMFRIRHVAFGENGYHSRSEEYAALQHFLKGAIWRKFGSGRNEVQNSVKGGSWRCGLAF